MDLAVKWRFFRHLLGGKDANAERIYRWHIEQRSGPRMQLGLPTDQWKKTTADYVKGARDLLRSMEQYGFMPLRGSIPVDPDGELLGGAHRVACAMALGIPLVSINRLGSHVWAPPWCREWFIEHGMAPRDLLELDVAWEAMR